jgi:membrane protein implicated in regulation of membrane protease activity
MIEYLGGDIFYWHWIVFGLVLITAELFATLFVMIWLGLASIVVGILQLAIGIDLNVQLTLWVSLSIVFLLFWHKLLYSKL